MNKNRKMWRFFIILMFVSCEKEKQKSVPELVCDEKVYIFEDHFGLKKIKKYFHKGLKRCVTENMKLSNWEASKYKRDKSKVKCAPQRIESGSFFYVAEDNFYTYRDQRVYINLNFSSGVGKRLIIGELEDGFPVISRDEFCFYLRSDVEEEPYGQKEWGSMLLFDLELAASSSTFHPMEIYKYISNGTELNLVKMDSTDGFDWTWCPTSTPLGFCDYLRNGNIMFYPDDPSDSTKNQLREEAILIRSELKLVEISEDEFIEVWEKNIEESIEVGTWEYIEAGGKWKYPVTWIFDEPLFVGRAWRAYLRGERKYMPDVSSVIE